MIIIGPVFGWQLECNRHQDREIWPGLGMTERRIRLEAVRKFGPGTKVRFWGDGSGHIFPPGYVEEEHLWSWGTEHALRCHLDLLIPGVDVWLRDDRISPKNASLLV